MKTQSLQYAHCLKRSCPKMANKIRPRINHQDQIDFILNKLVGTFLMYHYTILPQDPCFIFSPLLDLPRH
ncbi:hypothetical protein BpHYR1_008426 [Brachionus plicatilis]|uniref:Uncharacterized protein n=1 Tax=Brachionus plicatilis TaxID=10195 RepID=A0A3M7SB59_BRAPC|nr:hypothetical protein BpHYR1_008426 [Brachionus plicatilis]